MGLSNYALAFAIITFFLWLGLSERAEVEVSPASIAVPVPEPQGEKPSNISKVAYADATRFFKQGSLEISVYVPLCAKAEISVYWLSQRVKIAEWKLMEAPGPQVLEAQIPIPGIYTVTVIAAPAENCISLPSEATVVVNIYQPPVVEDIKIALLALTLLLLALWSVWQGWKLVARG